MHVRLYEDDKDDNDDDDGGVDYDSDDDDGGNGGDDDDDDDDASPCILYAREPCSTPFKSLINVQYKHFILYIFTRVHDIYTYIYIYISYVTHTHTHKVAYLAKVANVSAFQLCS